MSDFKSKVPSPVAPANLPTYDGGHPGKSAVRSELARLGGQEGIRSSEWADADGMTYRLDTRNGFPEIVATRKPSGITEDVTTGRRGFVAHVVNAAKSALFYPYDLSVIEPGYTVHHHTYTVLPFATTYNSPSADLTHWYDTLSFYNGKVLVNGLEMKSLKIGSVPDKALPWLIPRSGTGLAQYGDAIQNETEKRVFSIERDRVHSWMDGDVDAVLNNPSARPDKALMCGARIDPETHQASLLQLAFTGSEWDSLMGGWAITTAQVSMLLTPPYLTKIDAGLSAEQSLCIPQSTGSSSGTEETAYDLPPCQVGLHGTGFAHHGTDMSYVRFYYDSAWVEKPDGYELINYERSNYSKENSGSTAIDDLEINVEATNAYYNGSQTSSVGMREQVGSAPGSRGDGDIAVTDTSPEPIFADPWGASWWGVQEDGFSQDTYSSAANLSSWQSHKTEGRFSISAGGYTLVGGSFSRYVVPTGGTQTKFTAHDWAIAYYYPPGTFSNLDYLGPTFQVSGLLTDPAKRAIAAARVVDFAGNYDGVKSYSQNAAALGYGNFGDRVLKKYDTALGVRDPVDDRSLNWATKDFLLYDSTNGFFISIDASFSGSQSYGQGADAQLSVVLTVTTPFGVVAQTLFETPLRYTDLLPEEELEYSFTYVPSPQQRVIFAPLFRDQGDFKGAAYTTAAELANGALPTCLFNFVLKLDTYYAVGTDTSNYQTTNFIPCNLLEMLYAYVYSSKYGVDQYERYPVDNAARYNAFQNSLFSAQWRVNYRDGVFIDWLDTLGAPYIADTMTELYRA